VKRQALQLCVKLSQHLSGSTPSVPVPARTAVPRHCTRPIMPTFGQPAEIASVCPACTPRSMEPIACLCTAVLQSCMVWECCSFSHVAGMGAWEVELSAILRVKETRLLHCRFLAACPTPLTTPRRLIDQGKSYMPSIEINDDDI
jgi:hypothetical protein